MKEKKVKAYTVEIFIAGDFEDAKRTCKKFCDIGLCVTVEKTEYIYTRGHESGVRIGLRNYPRFPADKDDIYSRAYLLAIALMDDLFQTSAMLCDSDNHTFLSTRDID